MNRRFGLISALLAAAVLAGCSSGGGAPQPAAASGKVRVATSFYPVYEFTQAVGGDRVEVTNLVPAGVEPHDWEPTSKDMKLLNQSRVIVYNGAGMEHWIEKTLKSLDKGQQILVETTRGLDLMKGEGEEGAEWDPHVWLDPALAAKQVELIRDALSQADPAGKETYAANAAAYTAKLQQLDGEIKAGLSSCRTQTFYTSHSAFNYFARRYGLKQRALMGLAPDAEPKPKDLADLTNAAKAEGIKYIFFETLASDKVAKTLAREVGAQTLVLNPLEGLTPDEVKAGQSYLTVMHENLAHLKTAMECGK